MPGKDQGIPTVSVIISCYNQAHYLTEAIESGLAQTYQAIEILVIDDGSTDETGEVARRYPTVRYIRQSNRGLAAARNTGIHNSTGAYLVFLDADDRLLPNAVESGLNTLMAFPGCAFVFGKHRMIDQHGAALNIRQPKRSLGEQFDSYAWLLQGNQVAMHATVLYRRDVFSASGAFNPMLPVCEDYDLYLRITRHFPIAYHDELVAEYRQHGENMSRDIARMLATVLSVLRQQRPFIRGNSIYRQMYRKGFRNWIYFYCTQLLREMYSRIWARDWRNALQVLLQPWRYVLGQSRQKLALANSLAKKQVKARWRRLTRLPVHQVSLGSMRQTNPAGQTRQDEPQGAIDCYYESQFLASYTRDVRGKWLQLGDTASEGSLGYPARAVRGKETGRQAGGYPPETFDCLILRQRLSSFYHLQEVVEEFHQMLRPGGVLLATLPGIHPENLAGKGYWSFTGMSARRLFAEVFPSQNVKVVSYGNALAATAFLQHLTAGSLQPDELNHCDPCYPIVIGVRAKKTE